MIETEYNQVVAIVYDLTKHIKNRDLLNEIWNSSETFEAMNFKDGVVLYVTSDNVYFGKILTSENSLLFRDIDYEIFDKKALDETFDEVKNKLKELRNKYPDLISNTNKIPKYPSLIYTDLYKWFFTKII